jgi:hypothetical protein
MLRDYAAWNPSAKGRGFDKRTIAALEDSRGPAIMARAFERSAAPAENPGAADRLGTILARLSEDPVWWSLFEGWVDHASEAGVAGWIYSPPFSDLRFPVTVWVGDRKVAEGTADLLREDLVEGKKGDGRHGFALPVSLKPAEAQVVRVELGNSGCALERIPSLQGARTSRAPAGIPVAAADNTR